MTAAADRGTGHNGSPGSSDASWIRRWYGSGPAHVVTLALGGLVGIYAGIKLVSADPWGIVLWFVAAAVIHDIVLVPAYTALDRGARAPLRGRGVPFWYDHVRVPVMLSGLLFMVFFPLILGFPEAFPRITGTSLDVYLPRYLAMVAGLFALSGLALLARIVLRRR